MFLLNLIINTVSLSVYVESIAYPWISWRLLLEIKKSAVWNCQLYIYLFLAKLILKSQQKKNQIFLILWRGVDRIWTGGYWCCRPLPYHLATTPYLILLYAEQLQKMTPTGIEPVLPPWKGDVLTAWPRSLFSFLDSLLQVSFVEIPLLLSLLRT